MRQVTGFVILMGAAAFMTCAAQTPATSATPATTSTPAQAPATTTSAPAPTQTQAPATAAATSASTSDSAPKKPFKKPFGYEMKTVNGTDLYCRKDPIPGSRTQKQETCLTQEQLEARTDSSRDYMEQVQRTGGLTSGTGGGLPAGGMGR